jgi:hypothetical protein
MIKSIAVGLWVCIVTVLSTYAVVTWQTAHSAPKEASSQKLFGGLEAVRTRMISVPVIDDGTVRGYVTAQFIFTVDAKLNKRLSVKPDLYLLDEAFRTIYEGRSLDPRHFKKQDLSVLAKEIAQNVNKRLGLALVDDVLIQELAYTTKDGIRGNLKSN